MAYFLLYKGLRLFCKRSHPVPHQEQYPNNISVYNEVHLILVGTFSYLSEHRLSNDVISVSKEAKLAD